MSHEWKNSVLKNFDNASENYNQAAVVQKRFAEKLVEFCSEQNIPQGRWIDLGSGTGLLADALEDLNPNQTVIRVDGSKEMLNQHSQEKSVLYYNLEKGLPRNWSEAPSLIASNFALHWLSEPTTKLQEWFSAISPGGWLAVSLPVEGCFPEWQQAACHANVTYTAMNFPSHISIANAIPGKNIRLHRLEKFTQTAPGVTSLLKSLIKVGAQASPKKPLSVSQWRKIYKSWPLSKNNKEAQLTWVVQILLVQK